MTPVEGLHRALDGAARAASAIARAGTIGAGLDSVSVSARAAARAAGPPPPPDDGLEKPLVDLRIAKYAAAANLRALKTEDDLAREALAIVAPRREAGD